MLRDYSVYLYLTKTLTPPPETCEDLEFIVRAESAEEALRLALSAKDQKGAWNDWRLFELNVQEILRAERFPEERAAVLSGPTPQSLVRQKPKKFLGLFRI
jgi:hypothetical protein